MEATMPCKIRRGKHGETCSSSGIRKTIYACIVEADESTRKRLEETLNEDHADHIAGKGINSLNHDNFVHKIISVPQAMKILEAKAAVERKKEKLEKIPRAQVRNKKDVIDEARKEGKTVHFASLMDLCHLKNSELEPTFQKHKLPGER